MKLSLALLFLMIACGLLSVVDANAEDNQGRPDSFDLLGYFPKSDMKKRIRAYQFRASFLVGPVLYTSVNVASDASIMVSTNQIGFRLEADRWFQFSETGRRNFGISADLQKVFVSQIQGLTGDPLSYLSGSLLFGWRFAGYGHTQPWSTEAALLVGPALEEFPVMQLSVAGTSYRLSSPRVLGTRAGLRMRIPLISRFQLLSLELAGFVTVPHLLLGDVDGTLAWAATRSLGGNALIDFKLMDGVILGVGGYLGWFTLSYTTTGLETPDLGSFLTQSFVTSIRFLF